MRFPHLLPILALCLLQPVAQGGPSQPPSAEDVGPGLFAEAVPPAEAQAWILEEKARNPALREAHALVLGDALGGAIRKARLGEWKGRNTLLIPLGGQRRRLLLERLEENGPTVTLTGSFLGEPGSQAILSAGFGRVVGTARVGGASFRIRPLPGSPGLHVVETLDLSLRPGGCGCLPPPVAGGGGPPAPLAFGAPAPSVIDLLVVYTPAARALAGGEAAMRLLVQNEAAVMNQALRNSRVPHRVRLVQAAETPYLETGDGATSLSRLTVPGDGYMDEVHDLRDAYGADLVALIVAHQNVGGMAWILPAYGAPDGAFSVTAFDALGPPLIFQHELGHNLGCDHDRASAAGYQAYPYAYGYYSRATESRDIMAYPPGEVVPYFSSPDVLYLGYPLGVPDSEDNARCILNTGPVAAAYRPVRVLTADAGPDQDLLSPGGGVIQVALDGRYSLGPATPLGFAWREAGTLLATGENPTVLLGPGVHAIDLTVTDAQGQAVSDRVLVTVRPATIRVPADYPTLQAAVDASGSGGLVLVAPGTYAGPGNRDVEFRGKSLTVRSEAGPYATTLDCGGSPAASHRAFHLHEGEPSSTRIDGFTLLNGWVGTGVGGAVLCEGASPTLANLVVRGGTAFQGGAIFCRQGSVRILACTLQGNTATYGGAVGLDRVSDALVSGALVADNRASQKGGGMFLSATSRVRLENLVVLGNAAGDRGGGIALSAGSDAVLANCSVAANTAVTMGGGLLNTGTEIRTGLRNCVFWGNGAPTGPQIQNAGTLQAATSDVQGGWPGTGNLDADPRFLDLASGDLRLGAFSPCLDAADASAAPSLDADGNPRHDDVDVPDAGFGVSTYVDLGAYERQRRSGPETLSIALTPRATTFAPGGTLVFDVHALNLTGAPRTAQFWVEGLDPSGIAFPRNPVLGPLDRTLPAGLDAARPVRVALPGALPPGGPYTLRGFLGQYPASPEDVSSFTFWVVVP